MRVMGLESIAPKKRISIPQKAHKIYPYLLRGLEISYSNQVWCSDLTYIRLRGGFVYLTVVMDWYSRYVLSWEVSVTSDDGFCVSALERALRLHGKPEIFNTDRGSHSTTAKGRIRAWLARPQLRYTSRALSRERLHRLWDIDGLCTLNSIKNGLDNGAHLKT